MLNLLNIKGALISADAMNTQIKIVDKIVEKKDDYVLCIKLNQKKLHDEIFACFHKNKRETPEFIDEFEEIDSGHGRIEVRKYRQLRVNEWISEANNWSNIQTVIEVVRERHIKDKKIQQETFYYINSLAPDVEIIGKAIRSHWGVESVHWILDVSFKEDDRRIYNEMALKMLLLLDDLLWAWHDYILRKTV